MLSTAWILRLLATNYIFIEVSPDVFANNRLSTVLDTGKHLEELISKSIPFCVQLLNKRLTCVVSFSLESKHIRTLGLTSIIEHVYDFLFGVILIQALTTFM